MAKEMFLAKITLKDKNRKFIPQGTEFEKGDIHPYDFEAHLKAGTIYSVDNPPAPVASRPPIRSLVNNVPMDRLDASKNKGKATQQRAAAIWTVNPEDVKDATFEVLLSVYQETCEKFDIVPAKYTTREEVIAQLSSQFVPTKE